MATSRRIQSYAQAILRWKLSENTAIGTMSFANTGSYSGHAMTIGSAASSAVTPGVRSVIQRGVRFNGARGTQRAYLSVSPTVVPTASVQMLTMSCWIIIRQYNATASCVVFRKNRNSSKTAADTAYTFALGVGTTGALRVSCTTGTAGSGTQTITASTTLMKENTPYLIAGTYDGINFRGYINGDLVLTTAKTGNLDWGTDASNLGGDWAIGGPTTTNASQDNQAFDGIVEEAVVETAVIPEAMLRARFLRGMGLRAEEAA